MNQIGQTEKHPSYWYSDRIQSISMPNGMKKLLCPFCPFSLESKGYHRDWEVVQHIEELHPENIEEVYDRLRAPGRQANQKTLEGF